MFRRKDKDGKQYGNWYFWHPVHGRRVSTGTTDRALARLIVSKAEREAQERKAGVFVPRLGERVDVWLELNAALSSTANQKAYGAFWKQHLGDYPLNEITRELAHDTMKTHRMVRLDSPCKENATANNYLAFIAKIIRDAGMQPPRLHFYPVPKSAKRWLRPEEWARLVEVMPNDLRHIATFSLATGLRASNVALFEWIWLHERSAFLPASVTKTGDAYGVPLNRTALQVIDERKNHSIRHTKLVFLNDGRPWTKFTYYYAIQRAAEAAGLQGVNVHTFRHTFASWLAQAGVPDAIRKRLGCWSNGSEASAAYVHFDVEPLRVFAEKLDACLGFVSPDTQGIEAKALKSRSII